MTDKNSKNRNIYIEKDTIKEVKRKTTGRRNYL